MAGQQTDVCAGGHDRDRYVACERRKERGGPKPPSPPHVKLPPYRGTHPEKDLLAFLPFLRQIRMVDSNQQLGRIIARFLQLRRAANDAVEVHWRKARADGVAPKTAALGRSVEYLDVRRVRDCDL